MSRRSVLSIDFETASTSDLRRTGAHTYSQDPNTRALCMAWAFDAEPVQVWREGQPVPSRVADHVWNLGTVRGWNVSFELAIWNNVLRRQVPGTPELDPGQVEDTMAAAAYWGLPLALDMAAGALNLPVQKDKVGHDLMMRMCRPRYIDALSGVIRWWHLEEPERFDRLCDYCRRDVETERAVANAIPPLPPAERFVWALDQKINARGVGIDYDLVLRLRDLADRAAQDANSLLSALTGGKVRSTTSTAALLNWLRDNGYPYDNLRKETVAARLDEIGVPDLERRVLELRADTAKTSAAKLTAMLNACTVRDGVGRVRGMLQYYGAFRTGRWAGRLLQPQNLPRGTVKDIDQAIDHILAGADPVFLEGFYGPVLGVISSALRGCIVAEPGNVLVVADFAQIEARVIAWLAGQLDILQVFARGDDVYCYTASRVTGQKVDKGNPLRQLGKVLVLACGFGMSAAKFKDTAATYGVDLTDTQAVTAVDGWRAANSRIVSLWWDLDRAAKQIIGQGPNTQPVTVGHLQLAMWHGHMLMRLPSGRTLTYRDARLLPGPRGPEITYMGVNQYTHKWTRLRTYGGKLAENATQAVARDVMAEAVKQAEMRTVLPIELLVHDEIIGEVPAAQGQRSLNELLAIMRTPPGWAPDLPVDAEGWFGPRYKK